jgi:uncharacterized protein (TIGR02246 family)
MLENELLTAELTAREAQRREALIADDRDRLADLMSDDLVHVHTTGNVHDKAQLLDHTMGFLRFLDVQRGPLLIRALSPDAAVMTGPMTNVVQRRGVEERVEVQAFVTQVWTRNDGVWRIASFHAVRLPE